MSHSPEPWRIASNTIQDANGEPVVSSVVPVAADWSMTDSDARRIVACVNACRGHSTERLEAAARGECYCLLLPHGNPEAMRKALETAPDSGIVEIQTE